MYSTTPPDVNAVALAVYHESRGEPRQCQILVASVVTNRMKTRDKNARQVVSEPGQFSWYNTRKRVTDKDAWHQSVAVARHALATPNISRYEYFHKGKRGGYRCGRQVFSVAYRARK